MENNREKILSKIEGYMKFRRMTKTELAKKWGKTEVYVHRRLKGKVELSLTDIQDLCSILNLSREEAMDIFF